MLERDIEKYLVRRAAERGHLARKVAWVGQRSAPDRVLMLVGGDIVWVELKAPGKAATFPANPHERAQDREHERMRRVGQRVLVIDSVEGVDALLA